MTSKTDKFTNIQLADIFDEIADLLEIKGEVIYKVLAYRKAAESLRGLSREAIELSKEGRLLEIPGVGKAIAEKVEELLATGRLEFREKLNQEIPSSLVELLKVPGLGPKKVALFWRLAGITNLLELEESAHEGMLRSLPGMGEKSEAKIKAGIETLRRRSGRVPLGKAWRFYEDLALELQQVPGVIQISAAGSLRRRRSTVGDIDILVATSDPLSAMLAFVNRPQVIRINGHGDTKSSVEFDNGLRAQLWAHPPERFGTALQYATGSKEHNVRLREIALKKRLSLSEHSLSLENGNEIYCANEVEVYYALGLPWIPPELREDRGEIQAALSNNLPTLIAEKDIIAELHTHSTWSDGRMSIRELTAAAMRSGKRVLAITDHSRSLGVAGGLSVDDLSRQREEINRIQAEFGDQIRLLLGSEVEILADGSLDYPDEILAGLDIVIASLHSSLQQSRGRLTERLIKALSNPHVDIIAHPTGRMFPDREGADLDLEAVFQAALASKVALEINAHPSRLDLDDIPARRALNLGIPLSINTDAHSQTDLELLHYGVGIARRAWATVENVLNAWPADKLMVWLQRRAFSK